MIYDQEKIKQLKIEYGSITSIELVQEGPPKSSLPIELETIPAPAMRAASLMNSS